MGKIWIAVAAIVAIFLVWQSKKKASATVLPQVPPVADSTEFLTNNPPTADLWIGNLPANAKQQVIDINRTIIDGGTLTPEQREIAKSWLPGSFDAYVAGQVETIVGDEFAKEAQDWLNNNPTFNPNLPFWERVALVKQSGVLNTPVAPEVKAALQNPAMQPSPAQSYIPEPEPAEVVIETGGGSWSADYFESLPIEAQNVQMEYAGF